MNKFSDKEILEIMKDDFGFVGFKSPAQKESVEAVLNGEKNIIVSMATNSGKSLCFQLPSEYKLFQMSIHMMLIRRVCFYCKVHYNVMGSS